LMGARSIFLGAGVWGRVLRWPLALGCFSRRASSDKWGWPPSGPSAVRRERRAERIWLCAFDCAGLVHPSVRAPLKFDLFFFSHSRKQIL
jgi:hypothetical protein